MRRELVVAFAVVASILVATTPVAGSHQLATASIHTTDTDFEAGTLTNMTVTGSGESATVQLSAAVPIDGFEDGDITEYSGNTTDFTVQSSVVADGSNALEGDVASNGGIHDTDTFQNLSVGNNYSVKMQLDSADPPKQVVFSFAAQQEVALPDDRYRIIIDDFNSVFRFQKVVGGSGTTIVDDSVEFSTGVWYTVSIDWGSGGDFSITLSNASAGDITTLTATDTEFSEGGHGFQVFDDTGGIGYFDTLAIDQGAPGEYISANHTVEDSEQGFVNMTEVTNATVTVTWETNDSSGWSTLNETSGITTAANHTFTWSVESNDTVRVNVTVFNESGNGEPAFTMADEGVQFTAAEQTVNNSSASPTGGLSTTEPTLSIDINDSDFPLAQGDNVTVEFFVDGSSEGTDTLTANGTAQRQVGPLTGGDHNWSVTATDDYGHSVDSQTFDISVPGNLTIRNETSPYGIVTGCNATVRFFEDVDNNPTIVERTDSDGDGNISLVGLPVDGEFTVSMKCNGYHNRTIIIEDIFAQQSAFMLSEDRPSVENRFTVEDRTGDFSPDVTEIIIQKAINRSKYGGSPDGFSWTNIAGDDLGASQEFVVDLEEGDRYRIKVQNNGGDQRILGAHNADLTATFNLVIGTIILDPIGTDQPAWEAERTNETGEPVRVTFEYNDSVQNTTKIWLHIYEFNNESNELLANTSFTPSGTGNFGTFTNTEDVPAAENETTWVVDFLAERESEDNIDARIIVGPQRDLLPELPGWLLSIIYVGTILIVAGLFSQLNADVGALAVAGVGAVMFFAGIAPDGVGSGVMLLALMVAGVMFLNGRRGGGL